MAYPVQPAAGEPDRKAAVRDLIEDLDSMAATASHIPEEEMNALIDEADLRSHDKTLDRY